MVSNKRAYVQQLRGRAMEANDITGHLSWASYPPSIRRAMLVDILCDDHDELVEFIHDMEDIYV